MFVYSIYLDDELVYAGDEMFYEKWEAKLNAEEQINHLMGKYDRADKDFEVVLLVQKKHKEETRWEVLVG